MLRPNFSAIACPSNPITESDWGTRTPTRDNSASMLIANSSDSTTNPVGIGGDPMSSETTMRTLIALARGDDPLSGCGDPRFGHHLAVAGQSIRGAGMGAGRVGPADEGDPPMSEAEQVPGGSRRAGRVIDRHSGSAADPLVDVDQRHPESRNRLR